MRLRNRRAGLAAGFVYFAPFLLLLLILLGHDALAFQGCPRAIPLGKAGALRGARLCDRDPGAQRLKRVAQGVILRRKRQGLLATKSAIDFDSVRGTLREVILAGSGALGLAVVGTLLATAATGSKKGAPLTAEGLVRWARGVTPEEWQKLAICLLLDVAGVAPEFLAPGPAGEALDAAWAPLYAAILFGLFGARPLLYKSVLAASGFLEEVLPYTDLIPSATIGWLLENSADRTARELKGGFEDLVNTKRRPGQDE